MLCLDYVILCGTLNIIAKWAEIFVSNHTLRRAWAEFRELIADDIKKWFIKVFSLHYLLNCFSLEF